jgi:hypothetical protein
MHTANSKSCSTLSGFEQQSLLFLSSAFMFRIGLGLETFEVVRPFGILLADYFFFVSLLLLVFCQPRRLLKSTGSGVLLAGTLMLCGAVLASLGAGGLNTAVGSLARLFVLFGLFGQLAVVHSRDFRKNMLFLVCGVSANGVIALLQASLFPRIGDVLSINDITDDTTVIGRFAGLAGHPNILGLSTALAVLIGVGLLLSEKKAYVCFVLFLAILVCAVAALLSGSRTFLVSLIPGFLAFAFSQRRYRSVVLRGLLLLGVAWAGIAYLIPAVTSNYSSRFDARNVEDAENYSRLLTAGAAAAEIAQKPFTGWGAQYFGEAGMMFVPEAQDFQGAHVTFLHYWYAAGLLGAMGFLTLFVVPVRHMLRALKTKSSSAYADGLRIGLGVYVLLFIASNLHAILFNRFLFVPLFVVAGFAVPLRGPVPIRKATRRAIPLPAQDIRVTS